MGEEKEVTIPTIPNGNGKRNNILTVIVSTLLAALTAVATVQERSSVNTKKIDAIESRVNLLEQSLVSIKYIERDIGEIKLDIKDIKDKLPKR